MNARINFFIYLTIVTAFNCLSAQADFNEFFKNRAPVRSSSFGSSETSRLSSGASSRIEAHLEKTGQNLPKNSAQKADEASVWSEVGAKAAVEIGKWGADAILDKAGLTSGAMLRKEQEQLTKTQSQTELMRQAIIQEERRRQIDALDAEGGFKACMMQHGISGSNKIPSKCQEAAIFFARMGGERSDRLLDYRFE
jgi:hypothetical protein